MYVIAIRIEQITRLQIKSNDGLPPNVCVECALALRAAYSYKRMCERNDAKLRHIFQQHLNSARVKIERINENNEYQTVRPLEEHWVDYTISDAFDGSSPKNATENDDDWSAHESADSEKFDPTFDPSEAENEIEMEPVLESGNSAVNSNEPASAILSEVLKSAKSESGSWVCSICNKSFRNRRTLKLHVRRQSHLNLHGKGMTPGKVSRQPILRLKKDNTAEDGDDEDAKLVARAQCVDGRWACEICKKTFADRTTLKLHIRVHLGINLKQCTLCPKGFAKQSFLDFHMKSHEAKSYPCQKCDTVFNSKQELRDHTNDVHKVEKPPKTYMCEVCSKVFNRVNTLNQHRITHTGEKRFECETCHRKLGTKASLQ